VGLCLGAAAGRRRRRGPRATPRARTRRPHAGFGDALDRNGSFRSRDRADGCAGRDTRRAVVSGGWNGSRAVRADGTGCC
jgi:hypothetical protein